MSKRELLIVKNIVRNDSKNVAYHMYIVPYMNLVCTDKMSSVFCDVSFRTLKSQENC